MGVSDESEFYFEVFLFKILEAFVFFEVVWVNDLVVACVAGKSSEDEAFSCKCGRLHFFVAVFAEDCVLKYICHVYTLGVYYLNFIVVKVIKFFGFGI